MRILIIEDEKDIASFVKKGLVAEKFAVDCSHNGEDGLRFAKINDYDLVVLDIGLPGKDGLTVCRELREADKTFAILILSVMTDAHIKSHALNIGADDYLAKPFSFEELLARVRALLRRKDNFTGLKLKVADLELDSLTHNVMRGNKQIQLNRKEFSLLKYFMENTGIVLTRNMILEHVWDMNADPFNNTIDVHVRYLRKKIDDKKFKKKLLHTVHGYGYKIDSLILQT